MTDDESPDELLLGTRLRQAMEGVHTEPDRLVAGAVRDGRLRVRRRRVVAGVRGRIVRQAHPAPRPPRRSRSARETDHLGAQA